MRCRRIKKSREPGRLRKCIRVEQCNRVTVCEPIDGAIVRHGETDVAAESDRFEREAKTCSGRFDDRHRRVAAAAVGDDQAIGTACLGGHGFEAAGNLSRGVVGDDDQADGHGRRTARSSPPSAPGGGETKGVSMIPLGPDDRIHICPPARDAPTFISNARSHGSGVKTVAGRST